jgi:hypothetical protein
VRVLARSCARGRRAGRLAPGLQVEVQQRQRERRERGDERLDVVPTATEPAPVLLPSGIARAPTSAAAFSAPVTSSSPNTCQP